MTTDIRGRVYCNLGRLISGDISDDYLQESGLVSTRGSLVLDGIYSPPVGEIVQLAYIRGSIASRIPRTLRVISSFADPLRRTTTVEIGCKFTYFSNRKPPVEDPNTKDENTEVPCEVFDEAIIPISAAYVFQQCLDALGLVSDGIPLTNKFSIEKFDLTPGYIQVMSDLLSSEGYFCYLDESETVRFRSFSEASNIGPVIQSNQLIDLGPIGVGELPGDTVLVRYSSLTLKQPDELTDEQKAIQNWELQRDTSVGGENIVSAYKLVSSGTFSPTVYVITEYYYNDYTISETRTTYDRWDRVKRRETVVTRPLSAVNPSYLATLINRAVFGTEFTPFGPEFQPLPDGDAPCTEKQIELFYYAADPPEDGTCKTPEIDTTDYDSLLRKETIKYDSKLKVLGAVWKEGFYNTFGNFSGLVLIDPEDYLPRYKVEHVYEYYEKQVADLSAQSRSLIEAAANATGISLQTIVTKQTTKKFVAPYYTQRGQKKLANALTAFYYRNNIATVFEVVFGIKLIQITDPLDGRIYYSQGIIEPVEVAEDGTIIAEAGGMAGSSMILTSTDFSQEIGRFAGVDARPDQSSRANTANRKKEITESVAEIEWVTGSVESTAVIEFNLPYAPDDEITYSPEAGYGLVKSDAAAKALTYGRTQNALRLGNRNGISIQVSADAMPPRPFDPIYIEVDDIKGQYRINGTSYTFDATGIIASTDALFWGGVQ